MPIHSRTAIAVASILVLSALSGMASAQPPATDTPAIEPDDAVTDADAGEASAEAAPAEAPAQDGWSGAASGAGATATQVKAPAISDGPADPVPAAISPDTAPLGSSGGGGTGGNGRPTQDPVKDG